MMYIKKTSSPENMVKQNSAIQMQYSNILQKDYPTTQRFLQQSKA